MSTLRWSPAVLIAGYMGLQSASTVMGAHVRLDLQVSPGPYTAGQQIRADVVATAVDDDSEVNTVFDVIGVQVVFTWNPAVLQLDGVDMNDGIASPDKDFMHFASWGGSSLNESPPNPPSDGNGMFIAIPTSLFDVVQIDESGELVGTLLFHLNTEITCTSLSLLREMGGEISYVGAQAGSEVQQVGPQPGADNLLSSGRINGSAFPTLSITPSPSASVCEGESVTLTATGGFSSYSWSPGGATTQSIVVNAAGTYTVTATDSNGCQGSASIAVTVHPLPTVTITATPPSAAVCQGQKVTLDAGAGFSSYLWSTGAATQTIEVDAAGTYSVTVTNANGCQGTDDIAVTINPLPTVTITATPPSAAVCQGQKVTLDAGAGAGLTYLWSTGATTQAIDVTTAGTYSVTVTNVNGCQGTDDILVTIHPLPTVTIAATPSNATVCQGQEVTLDAGPGQSYLWSTGATTQTIKVAASGTYSVTVTNANACQGTDDIVVTVNPVPTVTIAATPPSATVCQGQQVTLDAGGGAGLTYLWSTGATTRTIEVSTAGTYGVTVTNANGCQATDDVLVTVNPLPSVTITATPGSATVCQGQKVTLDAGGGAGLTYLWSTGATSRTIEVSTAGTYSVTVTNANGCQGTDDIVVTVNPLPSVNITATPASASVCQGQKVTLDAGGGAGLTYLWSTGATTRTIEVATAGTYGVTVTNASGCQGTDDIVVTVNPNPTVAITATPPSATVCQGQKVTLDAGGGAGFTYQWSTGATTRTIEVATAGTYSVTVTNANGCQGTDDIVVTINPLPSVTITAAPPSATVCQGQKVTLDAGPGQSFLWSTGATTQTIDVTASGTYSVTVTNANGCQGTDDIVVTVNPNPTVTIAATPASATVCQGQKVTLDAGAGQSFLWSTGATTQTIEVTTAGTYSVTVTNANGCQGTDDIVVTVNPNPTVTIAATPASATVCQGQKVTLDAGGGAGLTYLWSTGATTQTIIVETAGTYSVTVTNASQCQGTDDIVVTVNSLPSVAITATPPSATVCQGQKVTLDAGAGFSSYLWSTGATTQTIEVDTAGPYSVTVTNASGCEKSASLQVTVNALPTVSITASPGATVCAGQTVTLDAGAGFAAYLWSTGANTQTIEVTAGGTYGVTVTNASGCQQSDEIQVTVDALPTVNITATPGAAVCAGQTVTLDAGAGFIGYQWSTGATTQTIDVTASGTYSVTVTAAGDCEAMAEIVVTVNPNPTVTIAATPPSATVCQGQTVTLDAGGGDGLTYLWSTGATTQTIEVSESGTYSVTVTGEGDCTGAAQIVVTVNPLPAVNITATPGATVCQGQTINLDAGAGEGLTYLWSTGAITQTIDVTTSGTYSVTVTAGTGCQGTDDIVVTVNPRPTATAANNGPVKAGDAVQLSGGPDGMAGYHWTGPGGFSSDVRNPSVPQAAVGQFEYCLTVTDANGCQSDPVCTTVVVEEACELYDMDYSGFVSIVGDVPPFVQCVYLQNCPAEPDPVCPGDCNGDGFLSIVGDVPCFVQCVYFANCASSPPAGGNGGNGDTLTIGGQVYTDLANPLLSGLAGVLVEVKNGGQTYTAMTQASPVAGLWQITVPPGTYTVTPSLVGKEFDRVVAGQLTGQKSVSIQVDVAHLAENQSIQFLARDPTPCSDPLTIGGQVYSDLANPLTSGVAGVHVVADGTCGRFETDTQSSPVPGLWRLENVPNGSYTLTLSKPGQCFAHVQAGQLDGQGSLTLEVNRQNLAANQSIQFLSRGRSAADFDNDCDVDASDMAFFVGCATGPAIPSVTPECEKADFDLDRDVDQIDFARAQRCFSGAGRPADPGC